ncbi:transposase, partial [Paenarthrobacter sp. YAF11_1]|uniref:transposase n=1 Tax=Paenarthrobacter sp. YAF11_1 TaxID=3233074 RepID=UPI003F974F52
KTAATILLTIGDAGTFTSAGHLAAYAGIAPVTRLSGTSSARNSPHAPAITAQNALFRSAWIASCHHPASKAYYQKKWDQGKKHNAAVICLARRRCDVIYSMLRHGTFYEENPAHAA